MQGGAVKTIAGLIQTTANDYLKFSINAKFHIHRSHFSPSCAFLGFIIPSEVTTNCSLEIRNLA